MRGLQGVPRAGRGARLGRLLPPARLFSRETEQRQGRETAKGAGRLRRPPAKPSPPAGEGRRVASFQGRNQLRGRVERRGEAAPEESRGGGWWWCSTKQGAPARDDGVGQLYGRWGALW